jgi:phosphopantothenoylcysteine decarboxylase / phosphopantothenate---cysteine ligase
MDVEPPAGVTVIRVGSADELRRAMHDQAGDADVIVMSAAVADFRPVEAGEHKIKRGETDSQFALPLAENADILHELVESRAGSTIIVGFAAETGDATRDVLTLGREKLARKGCDLLVVNDVSGGQVFGQTENEVAILGADGSQVNVPRGGKDAVADAVWDAVVARLATD